jgi:murein DD-endopeptidase MepM/ murein hydrolase activator NlpD
VLVVVGAGTAPMPVGATDWSSRIAATRASQLSSEATMRAADVQVRRLTAAERRSRRSLTAVRRRVVAARRHLDAEREERAQVRARLAEARYDLLLAARATPAWRGLDEARRAIDAVVRVGRMATPAVLEDGSPGRAPVDRAPAGRAPARGALLGAIDVGRPLLGALAAQVVALQEQAVRGQRSATRARTQLHRSVRQQRAAVHRVHSVAGSRRAAIARRESAEAGLGWAIVAMSDLARLRVGKKTSVRLGQEAGFAWPADGHVSQRYGCTGVAVEPSRGACAHFHDGLDVAGGLGSPIRAAAVGVVSYIGWNPWDVGRRAFIVVIAHPGGYETLYGHVRPVRHVRVGQLVRRGEVIGAMGSTGNSSGVHLHLELRRGRVTLDPLSVL